MGETLVDKPLPDLAAALAEPAEAFHSAGDAAVSIMAELLPLYRSITGAGLRASLGKIAAHLPGCRIEEVPSGTPVFDWTVPKEWNIREAYIKDAQGRTVVDFKDNNLHLVSYSMPVASRMSLGELSPRLHTIPAQPDLIPYRTAYNREYWGFCMSQQQRDSLPDGEYEVKIDASFTDGGLPYAEYVLPGEVEDEVLLFAHCCHPSTCNDNLTGIALAVVLAKHVAARRRRFTYRIVFAPASIGAITWLATREQMLSRIKYGLVLALLGDSAPLMYKKSRRGATAIDRIAQHVLSREFPGSRIKEFTPFGYDERQFCSPGIDLPMGRLSRSDYGEYPQYHSSGDNMNLIAPAALSESFLALVRILAVIEADRTYINLSPKGEPRLGARNLYRASNGQGPNSLEYALLWMLNQSDGSHSVLDIAERSQLSVGLLNEAALLLQGAGLLRPAA